MIEAAWFADAFATHTPLADITFRVGMAAVLGAVIGYVRERQDKPAGLKTHMMVALASAVFAVVSLELFHDALATSGQPRPDPVRIVEALVKGAAFLGAGAIIRGAGSIEGITTGASIWLSGAIGLACGTAHMSIALLALVLGVLVLTVVRWIEHKQIREDEEESS